MIEYIREWEYENGESWMDYAGDDFIFIDIPIIVEYWSKKFPDLYEYLMRESFGTIPWYYPQDGLTELIEDYYKTSDTWNEEDYRKSLVPWVSLIVENDLYFQLFMSWKKDYEQQ